MFSVSTIAGFLNRHDIIGGGASGELEVEKG
jgi:hypothetical protein